jgi:hypothetical protein
MTNFFDLHRYRKSGATCGVDIFNLSATSAGLAVKKLNLWRR